MLQMAQYSTYLMKTSEEKKTKTPKVIQKENMVAEPQVMGIVVLPLI